MYNYLPSKNNFYLPQKNFMAVTSKNKSISISSSFTTVNQFLKSFNFNSTPVPVLKEKDQKGQSGLQN
jgi:hypothetical protein